MPEDSGQHEAHSTAPGGRSHPSSAGSLRPPRTPSQREATIRSLGATSARSNAAPLVTPSSSAPSSRATSARMRTQRPATARQARRSSAASGDLVARSYGALAACFAEKPRSAQHVDVRRRPRALSDRLQRPSTAPPTSALAPLAEAPSSGGSSTDGSEGVPTLYTMLPASPPDTPRATDRAELRSASARHSVASSPLISAHMHGDAHALGPPEEQRFGLSGSTQVHSKRVEWRDAAAAAPVDTDFAAESTRLLQVRIRLCPEHTLSTL